jgi:glycine cleavage system H lipoate-binding protein
MNKSELQQHAKTSEPSPCIWMQADVISKKSCKLDYKCQSCHFDMVLQRIANQNEASLKKGLTLKGNRGKIVAWQEKLNTLPPGRRPCVHHMKQRIEFRACTHEYQCSDCEFDQYFQDEFMVHAVVKPVSTLDIQGFKIPQGYYLHHGHAWVKIEEDGEVRVGLDDFALRLLGPPDAIVSPLVGKAITRNKAQITLNRGENTARVLSPVNGVVTAVNPQVRKEGKQAAQNPYAGGWVLRVHVPDLRSDLKELMIGNETETFLKDEIEEVHKVVEDVAGPLAADGGFLGNDIYGSMPELGWENLAKKFLRSR